MDLNNLYKDLIDRQDSMDAVLDKGLVFSVASDDVYNGGTFSSQPLIGSVEIESRYVLASVETYLKYTEAVNAGSMSSVYASVETYLKFAEAVDGQDNRENKLFLPSINRLVAGSASMIDRLLDKGIVEEGWLRLSKEGVEVHVNQNDAQGGFSFLSRGVVDLDSEVWDSILDKGIVLETYQSPNGGRAVIASVETYLKYAEAVG